MAAQNLYTMEAMNLIAGDVGGVSSPGRSTHLSIQEMKLPAMEETFVDHAPGGAPIAIEIQMGMSKLEATFNLAGWQPDIMVLLGAANRSKHRYTINGLIRNKRDGTALQGVAILEGRLGRVNPTAFSKGNLMVMEYAIKEIISYQLLMQEDRNSNQLRELYFWDFFTSTFRVDAEDINADLVRILEIPGVAA